MTEQQSPSADRRRCTVTIDCYGAEVCAEVSGDADLPPEAAASATARALLLATGQLVAANEIDKAAASALAGIAALADHYQPGEEEDPSSGLDDDTDLKMAAAELSNVNHQRLALLRGVLEARLIMFGWRFRSVGLRFDPPLQD